MMFAGIMPKSVAVADVKLSNSDTNATLLRPFFIGASKALFVAGPFG